jgi:hypothetical protein
MLVNLFFVFRQSGRATVMRRVAVTKHTATFADIHPALLSHLPSVA